MPVTAKLSKAFYDRFGDDNVNELVNWFNSVDTSYKADLRELNDRNFALFDAKLEQRLAQLSAELRTELGGRIDRLAIDARFAAFESQMDAKLASLKADLIRWMFLFWIGTVVTMVGALAALK